MAPPPPPQAPPAAHQLTHLPQQNAGKHTTAGLLVVNGLFRSRREPRPPLPSTSPARSFVHIYFCKFFGKRVPAPRRPVLL